MGWACADATVVRGHRVASGACGDPRFPRGTIAPQLPFFRAAVPDLASYLGGEPFPGTLNLRMGGPVALAEPEIRLARICWTDALPPETFLLSRAVLEVAGRRHPAFLYIPDPATKADHPQPADRVELLAARIEGAGYGAAVRLHYREEAILIPADG